MRTIDPRDRFVVRPCGADFEVWDQLTERPVTGGWTWQEAADIAQCYNESQAQGGALAHVVS